MSIRTVASNTRSAMPTMAPVNSAMLRRECACGTHTHGGAQCHACSEQRSSAPSRHVGDFPTQNAVPSIVHDALHSPGEPLDQSTRAVMQASFDHDFSGVRIHADARAARSADVLQARAYTVGRDVVFADGAFAPHSHEGRRLIAHELAHVVQNGGQAQGSPSLKQVSQPHDASEREAHAAAHQVLGRSGSRVTTVPAALVQRDGPGVALGIGGAILGAGLLGVGIAALAGAFDKKPTGQSAAKAGEPAKKPPDTAEAISREQSEQLPLVSFEEAVKEGSALLKPEFGKTYGQESGVDRLDGYDASEWSEIQEGAEEGGRHYIESKSSSSWVALKHMFTNFGRPVPKADGGTTSWSFDCFEFVEILHLYARWRSLPAKEFDAKFPKLRIGFFSKASGEWQKPFKADSPKDKPYKEGEMKMVVKKNTRGEIEQTFEPGKEPAKKPWKQILREAPIGTQVIWTNEDAKKKCAADRNLSFCEAWINENATKIGPDRYNAFPLGEKDEASVKREMAQMVVDPVPPGYIEKNLYISTIIYPTDMSTPAAAPERH